MSMSRKVSYSLAAALCLCAVPLAAQTTLTFELGLPGYTTPVPAGYGGFQWSGNPGDVGQFGLITHPPVINTVDPWVCLHDGGNTCAFNDHVPDGAAGTQVSFSRATPFNFLSMLMGYWDNTTPNYLGVGDVGQFNVTVQGWLAGVQVAGDNQIVTVGHNGPSEGDPLVLQTFNWANVDQVTFTVDNNAEWFLADDITYSEGNVTPEPATLVLLGTGLMGLVGTGLLRRRKN